MLGRWISLEGRPFLVVGVAQEPVREKDPRWFHPGFGEDGNIVVPITAYQQDLLGRWERAADRRTRSTSTPGTRPRRASTPAASRPRYLPPPQEQDFEIKDYREIMAGALKQIKSFIASIAAIGIVAMLAGGIGILNVTLATVFSRVREIGVRRALGATRPRRRRAVRRRGPPARRLLRRRGSAWGAAAVLLGSPSERQIEAFSPSLRPRLDRHRRGGLLHLLRRPRLAGLQARPYR